MSQLFIVLTLITMFVHQVFWFVLVVQTSFYPRHLKNDSSWRAGRSDQLRHYACPPHWPYGACDTLIQGLTLWNLIWAQTAIWHNHGTILYPAECGNGHSNSLDLRKQNISRLQNYVNRSKTWCVTSREAFLRLVLLLIKEWSFSL